LNIVLSYPVKWSKQQVLRDLVQNFYDDAGFAQFGAKFQYNFVSAERTDKNGTIVMSMDSDGFSYEWLVHIGASTKQNQPGEYAGYFGEGFKMAALCAVRDFDWSIRICSRNWSLHVVVVYIEIDGSILKQLAFEIEETLEEDNSNKTNRTVLEIEGTTSVDYDCLKEVVLGFYYPENPLIGELIFSNRSVAIHRRSDIEKPTSLPISYDCHGDGIVFVSYQARGSFCNSLVLCNHHFQIEDRDRKFISLGTVQDVIMDMANTLDIDAAYFLLNELKNYWYDYPDSHSDVKSWYSVICKLIKHIRLSDDAYDDFREKHPLLVVCEKPTNTHMRNKRKQALAWRELHYPDSRLVQESFFLLGYDSLEHHCNENGGFNVTREASDEEISLESILKNAVSEILTELELPSPPCLIIQNESSVYQGTAHCLKRKKRSVNASGLRIRYDLQYIELKENLFTAGQFMNALATYCHELCHCFGGDASASFSFALTKAISLIVQRKNIVDKYHLQWEEYFEKDAKQTSA
jgi:hypothetical protein